jgi:hypothetical protein
MSKNKAKTVEEFDKRFDEGESVLELAEVKSASRPNLEPQRVNVDFPKHFLQKLDREAALRGISRQALIKTWLYERLELNAVSQFSTVSQYGPLIGVHAGGSGSLVYPATGRALNPEEGTKSPVD